jgi:hypothetical protein
MPEIPELLERLSELPIAQESDAGLKHRALEDAVRYTAFCARAVFDAAFVVLVRAWEHSVPMRTCENI